MPTDIATGLAANASEIASAATRLAASASDMVSIAAVVAMKAPDKSVTLLGVPMDDKSSGTVLGAAISGLCVLTTAMLTIFGNFLMKNREMKIAHRSAVDQIATKARLDQLHNAWKKWISYYDATYDLVRFGNTNMDDHKKGAEKYADLQEFIIWLPKDAVMVMGEYSKEYGTWWDGFEAKDRTVHLSKLSKLHTRFGRALRDEIKRISSEGSQSFAEFSMPRTDIKPGLARYFRFWQRKI